MYDRMGLLRGLDDTGYGRHRDTVSDWQNDRSYYYGKESDLYGRDYGQYMDQYNMWAADRDFGYQGAYDAQQQRNWEMEYQLAAEKARSGGSSGGGGGSKSSSSSGKTDWEAMLKEATPAQRREILYGYSSNGKGYIQDIQDDLGASGLEYLRKLYGMDTASGTGTKR